MIVSSILGVPALLLLVVGLVHSRKTRKLTRNLAESTLIFSEWDECS